jgi:hypothetical protein
MRSRLSLRSRVAMRGGCRGLCERMQLQLLLVVGRLHPSLVLGWSTFRVETRSKRPVISFGRRPAMWRLRRYSHGRVSAVRMACPSGG